MPDYLSPAIRLYLEKLVDWEGMLSLRRGEPVDPSAELGAYQTLLETCAGLAETFERPARENWEAEPTLTEDGGAVPPPHMRAAYEKLKQAGLVALTVSEEYGGANLPALLNLIVLELISRGDTSLMISVGLQTGIANDIERYGSEEVKRAYLPRFTSGEVMGCMDLTEPQAGSDLGAIRTRATDQPDGSVRIDGQKIFISNGGAEVHLVLARDGDTFEASRGTTNGLSLILVSRHLPDGRRNGVRVARLEKKLGIHGSPTCEVVFEDARGVRLGEKGKGFRAMLDLMNNARLGVAAQGLGLAEGALHEALHYARERKQFGQPILEQPLVMTMLAKMAVNLEGTRALLYRTAMLIDRNAAREAALTRPDLSDAERARLGAEHERDQVRVRLLTPLCKYYCTEVCNDVTRDAMQVFGGIGFTLDVDVAKMHTDSLILTVYEGTSEIQASFALREMGKGALGVVFQDLRAELAAMAGDETRARLAKRVESTIGRIEEAARALFADVRYALLRARLMAELVIDVAAATELLRQVGADPSRHDIAEAFVLRRMIEDEAMCQRIEQNAAGRIDRDARILAALA